MARRTSRARSRKRYQFSADKIEWTMSTSLDSRPHGTWQPRPFQFHLRTLLAMVAMLGVLLAIMGQIGVVWSVVLVWLVLLIAAHVIGNAFGTRLKMLEHQPLREAATASLAHELSGRPPAFAPSTLLRRHTRHGLTMFLATAAGAVLGGSLGCLVLALVYVGDIGSLGLGLGTGSGAVLGGLAGFLASTFLGVFSRAFREATREPKRP
jgi:hypothetical protein